MSPATILLFVPSLGHTPVGDVRALAFAGASRSAASRNAAGASQSYDLRGSSPRGSSVHSEASLETDVIAFRRPAQTSDGQHETQDVMLTCKASDLSEPMSSISTGSSSAQGAAQLIQVAALLVQRSITKDALRNRSPPALLHQDEQISVYASFLRPQQQGVDWTSIRISMAVQHAARRLSQESREGANSEGYSISTKYLDAISPALDAVDGSTFDESLPLSRNASAAPSRDASQASNLTLHSRVGTGSLITESGIERSSSWSKSTSLSAYLVAGLSDSESDDSLSSSSASSSSAFDESEAIQSPASYSSSLASSPTSSKIPLTSGGRNAVADAGADTGGHLGPLTRTGNSASSGSQTQAHGHGQTIRRQPSITITDHDRNPQRSRALYDDELVGGEMDEMDKDDWAEYEKAARQAELERLEKEGGAGQMHPTPLSSSASASNEEKSVAEDSKDPLSSDRAVQDSLTSELLRMARVLKTNSLAFGEALERDRLLLESTGEKLQGNLDVMTRTRGRLGEYAKKARGLGWATLGAVTVVCISWVLCFLLIRLT